MITVLKMNFQVPSYVLTKVGISENENKTSENIFQLIVLTHLVY